MIVGHSSIVSSDLADDIGEGIVNVDARLCRGFDEGAIEMTGEVFSLCFVRSSQLGLFKCRVHGRRKT